MPLTDGIYLIHSSAENARNYYTLAGYENQAVGTVSGGSFENPTEWLVQNHPNSNTYTFTAKDSQGKWTRSRTRTGDEIVIFSQNPGTAWSQHWKLIEIDPRAKDPLMAIVSAEPTQPGGAWYTTLDNSGRLRLEWIQGQSVHNWLPQWRFIKQ